MFKKGLTIQVLSTANKEWNATTTLIEKEKDNCYGFPKQKYPRYKVINNYDYTIDELIEKRTGIGLVIGVRIDIWTHLTRECIINYVH